MFESYTNKRRVGLYTRRRVGCSKFNNGMAL